MNTHSADQQPFDKSRRSFLGKLAWLTLSLVGGAMAMMMAVPGLGAAIRRRIEGEEWSPVASLTEIPENRPSRFNIVITDRAGWMANNSQEAVWLIRHGDQINAFSAVCPHAGCPIGIEARGFFCSCHGSRWSADGKRTGGPTPRNMDRLESQIRSNVVEVKYQRFKSGVQQKELSS